MAEETATLSFFHWRNFLKIEASGVRTSLATTLPLILGQILGYPMIGLYIGLSGLYLSVTDKEGSTIGTLIFAVFSNALMMFAGTIIGNDIWLSVSLLFVIAFIGGMMSAYGAVSSQIGYVSTLVFAVALGQPGSFEAGQQRILEFLVGGAWSVILTLVLWSFNRKTSSAASPAGIEQERLFEEKPGLWKIFYENLTLKSIICRHALRLGIASAIAIALYKIFRIEHGYWLIITVLVIVKPVFADTRKRALERVAGSVVGGIVAVIFAALIQNVIALDALLVLFSILAFSHVRTNYGFYVLFLTPFVVLMLDTVIPGDWEVAFVRILDTLLGGAIALIVSYLLRPKSSFKVL